MKMMEGVVAGAVLAVAAGIFLTSKAGKAVQKDMRAKAAEFYKSVSPKLKKMKKMGEKEYKLFMKNAAAQYARAKKMTEKEAAELMKDAQSSWSHLARHL